MSWSYWDNRPVATPEQLADPAWHSGEEIVCGWRGKVTAYDPARGTKGKRTYRTLDDGAILRLRYAIQGHKFLGKKVLRTEDPVTHRTWWVMMSAVMALVWQENRRIGIPTPPPRRRPRIIPPPESTGDSGEGDDDFI